jgi:hypothetical protein
MARRTKGVPLEIIAARTSIPLAHLQALESGHWDDIEKPFLAGYIRQYAQAAGLNADQILARYREITKGSVQSRRAQVDDTGDLLSSREFVGATRMKIVLGGFVGSRRFTLVLFVFLLAAFLATLVSANRVRKSEDLEMPFDQILNYARSASRGPIEFIPPKSPGFADSKEARRSRNPTIYDLIASESCFVMLKGDAEAEYRRHLQVLDTLRISVKDSLMVTVCPHGSAALFVGNKRILSGNSLISSVDTFRIAAGSERIDTTESRR